jgi:hypothetical protein
MEFPIDTKQMNFAGFHRRFHQKDLFNPMNLPPQHKPPIDWLDEINIQDLARRLEEGIPIDNAKEQLQQIGIGAVYVPTTPPNAHPPMRITLQIEKLRLNLGTEIELDCAAVWWLSTSPPPIRVERAIPAGDPLPKQKNTVIEHKQMR